MDKNLINIIKEEISNFDFLGNDERSEHEETITILNNDDFQKQFICDSLINRNNNIKQSVKDSMLGGDWNDIDDIDKVSLDYSLNIEYKYDQAKEPVKFILSFFGDNISVKGKESGPRGDYFNEPQQEKRIEYFNWDDVNVQLETFHGDDVKFNVLYDAPYKIQTLFIQEYLYSFLTQATGMDVENYMSDRSSVSAYC